MKPHDLSQRTYEFGLAVISFCKTLPDNTEARKIFTASQLTAKRRERR